MTTKVHRRTLAFAFAGSVVLSCSSDRSDAAATRIAELRARGVLGASVATRFEAAAGTDAATHLRAVLPSHALLGVSGPAYVALPLRADGEVKLEDVRSHLSVRFTLMNVQHARVQVSGGLALYQGAFDGADVVHRVHAEGTEDYVMFEKRPARDELTYSVDVSRIAGMRLVSNTLEFLDEAGAPRLRVAPPYVVDASGQRHEARLAVTGCAYDTSPAGPWGRKITKPGGVGKRCIVRVAWNGNVAYPAMVDPAWGSTGSMITARHAHTAVVLPSGRILVAGGLDSRESDLASAELFELGSAGAGTFAATGSMVAARHAHTASLLPSGKVLVAGGYRRATAIDIGGCLASAELFDPSGNAGAGSFVPAGSMTTPRYEHTASVLSSGRVLVAGGVSDGPTYLASAELFDPSGSAGAGAFTATGSMASARSGQTASVLPSGGVLVAGGFNNTYLASAELFDPSGDAGQGAFTNTGAMTTARQYATASVLPLGKVLVAGGCHSIGTCGVASADIFDPSGNAGAGAFVATGAMATARYEHTASVLPSGKVLVAAGHDGIKLSSAELFDPAGNAGKGAFASSGSLAIARFDHTASVLPSGTVVVIGGNTASTATNAEIFGGASGEACTANGYCLSGYCVDGVCCGTACSGTCEACAAALKHDGLSDGTCGPIENGTDPRNECAPSGVLCGEDGQCNGTGACRLKTPAGVSCASEGTVCDGSGSCVRDDATCDGELARKVDGTTEDCRPYKCESSGTCRSACTSVADCVAPAICNRAGACVQPEADTGSGGGCGLFGANKPIGERSAAWLAAAVALGIVRRRRRRAR